MLKAFMLANDLPQQVVFALTYILSHCSFEEHLFRLFQSERRHISVDHRLLDPMCSLCPISL